MVDRQWQVKRIQWIQLLNPLNISLENDSGEATQQYFVGEKFSEFFFSISFPESNVTNVLLDTARYKQTDGFLT